MTNYITAIRNVTHYSEKLIAQTIDMAERGIQPIQVHGSMQWDIWMLYRAIREYERLATDVTTA